VFSLNVSGGTVGNRLLATQFLPQGPSKAVHDDFLEDTFHIYLNM